MPDSDSETAPVLVVGATGKQGGAVARALLARGTPVRALVRRMDADKARAIEALGATPHRGDLTDPATLGSAVAGVRAVFSVQNPDPAVVDSERVQGRNLVRAAADAGVPQFVHSSVSGAGDHHRSAPGWAEGRWDEEYWESKAYTDDLVRGAGFPYWTILQPAFFMENLVRPSIMFVNWFEDRLLTVLRPETKLPLVSVRDIGSAVAAIIGDREWFTGREVQLAGDYLPMSEVAAVLSAAWDADIAAPSMSAEEMLAHPLPGVPPEVMDSLITLQSWMNEVGHPARPEHAAALGIPTTDLATWARDNAPG